jgi:hypothetical protein
MIFTALEHLSRDEINKGVHELTPVACDVVFSSYDVVGLTYQITMLMPTEDVESIGEITNPVCRVTDNGVC